MSGKSGTTPTSLTEIENVISHESRRGQVIGLLLKRGIDIIGATLGLVILSPIFLIIAVFIKLDSSGPVIFRQTRLGLNGKPFTFYKLRSMKADSDSSVHKEYVCELINGQHGKILADGGEEAFKLAEDKRVTRFGRFLRRTSLDELPQLFNVLKGDMSLVGPRPSIPYEVEMYKDGWKRRLAVIPGMTGNWQVNGRSLRNFEEMIKLDLQYIDNWSLLMDLKILLKTVSVVAKREGAW